MIDLHNHILPGVDDGAADVQESLEMARQFMSEGVVQVAATPHLDPLNERGIPGPEVVRRVEILQDILKKAGVTLGLAAGQEIYLTPNVPSLLEQDVARPLGSGPFVLVEVSFELRPFYLEDTMARLQLAEYRPILAHPERYAFVQRDVASIDHLVNSGVTLQLTAPALLGDYGPGIRRTAEQLLRRGAYALAASDRHHPGPARSLAALHQRTTELTDGDLADLLLHSNPRRVLAGEPVTQPELTPPEPRPFLNRLFGSL